MLANYNSIQAAKTAFGLGNISYRCVCCKDIHNSNTIYYSCKSQVYEELIKTLCQEVKLLARINIFSYIFHCHKILRNPYYSSYEISISWQDPIKFHECLADQNEPRKREVEITTSLPFANALLDIKLFSVSDYMLAVNSFHILYQEYKKNLSPRTVAFFENWDSEDGGYVYGNSSEL